MENNTENKNLNSPSQASNVAPMGGDTGRRSASGNGRGGRTAQAQGGGGGTGPGTGVAAPTGSSDKPENYLNANFLDERSQDETYLGYTYEAAATEVPNAIAAEIQAAFPDAVINNVGTTFLDEDSGEREEFFSSGLRSGVIEARLPMGNPGGSISDLDDRLRNLIIRPIEGGLAALPDNNSDLNPNLR